MPVPIAFHYDRDNVGNQLIVLGGLVKNIKLGGNTPPASNLATIYTHLLTASTILQNANMAGMVTDPQRHAIGDEFLAIANELKK